MLHLIFSRGPHQTRRLSADPSRCLLWIGCVVASATPPTRTPRYSTDSRCNDSAAHRHAC